MKQNIFTMPMYKATSESNHKKLMDIVDRHIPTLREYGLIKDGHAYVLQSEDGTIIEMYEWKDEKAIAVAHEHPAIRTIWGEMEGICTFPSLSDLPESKKRFPNFTVIKRY